MVAAMIEEPAIARAVRLCGGQTALARQLGIKQPSVHGWLRTGLAPAHRCRAIETATGGAVTVHELRPDVFGPAAPSAASAA